MSENITNAAAAEAKPPRKKRIFSAIQPSGEMTIGNYLGAIRNFSAMQDEFECIYATANLHTLTVRQDPRCSRPIPSSSMPCCLRAVLTAASVCCFTRALFPPTRN